MTTIVYLVRHGEVHNPKQILYGRLPKFGLSEKGKSQIQKTAEFLSDKNIRTIYSSPLLRTRQTAGIIQKKLKISKINILSGLIEVKTSLQGKSLDKLDLINLDYYSPPTWEKNDDTMEQIAMRMDKSIRILFKKHKNHSIVAVTHGDPIMILKVLLHKLPMEIVSIRKGLYVTHGEVIRLQQVNEGELEIESIFIPKL